ncbi:MAG: hypothetical protein L0H26_08820 [Microlunatus sp.]|nr:hypothetical protein [Microlunatus sp.]
MARLVVARRCLEAEHRIPLVVAREDHPGRLPRSLGRLLHVHEAAEQIEPGVPLPDPLPQIGGAVAIGVRWVARAAVVTGVEGEEDGACAGQPSRHGHQVRVDGEVDDRPGQGPVLRVAIGAVLGDPLLHSLPGERVLQLGGGGDDAVDQEGEVDGPPAARREP